MNFGLIAVNRETMERTPKPSLAALGELRQRIKIAVAVCTAATFLWYTGIKEGDSMDVFQNMKLFSELIQCGGNIYTWCYNADGSLLQSNCPEAGFASPVHLTYSSCQEKNAGLRQPTHNAGHTRHGLWHDMGGCL